MLRVRARRSNRAAVGPCLSCAAALLLSCCGCGYREGPPSVASVSPRSGNTTSQTFTLVYSAPNGFSDLVDARVLFAAGTDGHDACYVRYDPVHDTLMLADDDATSWTTVSLRGSGAAENSQCRIQASGSSASGHGGELTVRVAIEFKRAFAGRQNVFLSARERQGLEAPFTKKGTWVVPYFSDTESRLSQ